MKEDTEGFLYPVVDKDSCIDCGICDSVCPILNKVPETEVVQNAYLLQHNDSKILRESTSGGAFTAIGQWAIKNGGVVFGAAFNSDFSVSHHYVCEEENLKIFRNSKYVQSSIGNAYVVCKNFLDENRIVVFSGTPCQIEGLLIFLKKDYSNLITVDVVCRAVPSPLLLRKYVDWHQNKQSAKVSNVLFRDKHWGYQYSSFSVFYENHNEDYHKGVESDPYLRAFFSNMSVRPSCYHCCFKKRYRISDITIWDCFQAERFSDEFDGRGTSRVLVHSETGKKVLEASKSYSKVVSLDVENCIKGVREMKECVPLNELRSSFFADLNELPFDDLIKKYFPDNLKVKIERFIRVSLFRMGVYSCVKRVFLLFYKNKKNQK